MILTESDLKAAQAVNQAAAAQQTGGPAELWPPLAMCLLGDKVEAEKAFPPSVTQAALALAGRVVRASSRL